ncbi:MAG: phosphonate ABC transporter, permease protein PhnE [Rhizobiales bacterium 65-9]|nr:phosphonate ABC transporter, permease protein PhnE [Hyphomicrobiales bacterium]OJY40177.1 MAG: phosphonate ABC transporter, permease protein PhnE [Rhizobiales bacterium 65-9]
MSSSLPTLPDAQLAPLLEAYKCARAAKLRQTALFFVALTLAVIVSAKVAEIDLFKLGANIGSFFNYFSRLFVFDSGDLQGRSVLLDIGEWYWGFRKWLRLLGDTLLIAYVGTFIGALGAFLICFSGARNLSPNPWVRGVAKRALEFFRTVPEIVFALIFVIAFGLGPIPGVLALSLHTFGALGKQFLEVVENIDMRPVEGATACGASWVDSIRFAVVPQVLSNFVSYTLLRFEINVRGASVMGFVGAGGIGQDLIEAIRKFYYTDVSAILLMIIATVMIVDIATAHVRHRLIGLEEAR